MVGLGNSVDAGTTGFQSLNAATGIWNGRSLVAGGGIDITNTNGTGGNPTISSSPGLVNFTAVKTANSANVTGNGTVVTVIYDTADFNVGGGYNTGTGIFTVPVGQAGKYFFEFTIAITGTISATMTTASSFFIINGVNVSTGWVGNPFNLKETSSGSLNFMGHLFINLAVGDTVQTRISVSGGAQTVTLAGIALPTRETQFSGFKVA